MRFVLASFVTIVLAGPMLAGPALAQTPPRPAQTPTPARGGGDPITASYATMTPANRVSIQVDLIWTGDYVGDADGQFGPRAIAAVKAFQKRNRGKETGVLNPKERSELAAAARRKREAVGWRIQDDIASGTRFGLPGKIVTQQLGVPGGTRWSSPKGDVVVETFRIAQAGASIASVYESQRAAPDFKGTYTVARADFFVVSGTRGAKKIYMRAQGKGEDIRGFSIQYDPALSETYDVVAVAMASAFQGFPAGVPVAGPPPRRKVEYASAVFVTSEGHALTARDAIDGCLTYTLAGYGPADLVADDKDAGIALLRVYGAGNLKPVALADGLPGANVTLVGIADPQSQGGAGAVSTATARLASNSGGFALEPTPALGFAGAAAIDGAGKLGGIADVRVQVVAGPPASTASQGRLIAATALKSFLSAQNVTPQSGALGLEAARGAVARVICVRK